MSLESTRNRAYVRTGESRQLRLVTDLVTIRATPADTGDAALLYEVETPPAGGTPPHAQRYDDETLVVLEGTYTVLVGDEQAALGPGDMAFVPRGTVHAYANAGSTAARMLVLVTPGRIHEQFLDDVSDRAGRAPWEPDMARLLAVAPRYGVEFAPGAAEFEPGNA